jgi:hypothetical protein
MQLNGLGTRAYALGLVWSPIFLEKKKVDGMSPAMVDNMSSSNSDFDRYYSVYKMEGIGFFT